jgi:acyltransferase
MPHGPEAGQSRIPALDLARLLGLLLMYYGHVVERMMYLQNAAATAQYKLIYSFHMPLFFVLAGMVAPDFAARYAPGAFARSRLASRLVPLLFFNGLLAGLSLLHTPDFPPFPLHSAGDYARAAASTLTLLPIFDVPTWFLMCLVTVEVLHFALYRFLRGSTPRLVAALLAFYAVGYALNRRFDFFGAHASFWFWNEAITVYAFYLLGVLLKERGVARFRAPAAVLALGAAVAFAIVFLTYDLNQGPFRLLPAVVILAAGHGHALWFPLTAVAGTLGVLLLARLLPGGGLLQFLGRNGLILFGLNGVAYHHVNGPLAAWFVRDFPGQGWSLTAFSAVVTAVSVALAVPLVWALDRWLPQLVGRPTAVGPLLPALVSPPAAAVTPASAPADTPAR